MRRRAFFAALLVAGLTACGSGEPERALPETVEGETPTAPATTAPAAAGDPAAGEEVFAAEACGGCHTFEPAGSSGETGPNLDELAQHAEEADRGSVEEYTRESIEDPNAYVVPGFAEGIMPAYDELSDEQLNDLVAFLVQDTG